MKKSWDISEYGSFEIKDTFNLNNWHVWIQPRQSYCDRGHWEWGYSGIGSVECVPEPSYYFMSLDTAVTEVEEYLFRAHKGTPSPTRTRSVPEFDESFWVIKKSDGSYNHLRNTPSGGVAVTVSPHASETGSIWVVEVEGVSGLDGADAFPRVYFYKESALSETERFLKWRLEKQPFEHTSQRVNASRDLIETYGRDAFLEYGEHLQSLQTHPTEHREKIKVFV